MKIYFTLILVAVVTSSCLQSFDDIKPTNKVSSEDVWKDPDAVSGILAHMYNSLIFEDFSYFWGDYSWRSMDLVTMSDEGTAGFQKEPCFDQEGATWEYPDDFLGYYIYIQGNQGGENIIRDVYRESYVLIRRCNEFLEDLKTATLESDDLDSVKGEAKFLRAMAYFTLVKRFGGVPLITEAKPFEGDIVSLQEPRATEKAIWDFIINEAEEASQLLPLIRSTGVFRATSGAALALESRAALYAGSIAKYGTVGFGKLTGIDKEAAEGYFETAYR
ncbi:MAG: RagB/SusD family nutrient uptake outer membrane protein, partial [Bacteroidales bacterium]|nr:RagB/SusD family nutrient uptake outer membrane protein [Bacteroidales bacterium]